LPKKRTAKPKSAFAVAGFNATVQALEQLTRQLYLEDQIPWVVGYSGGKDSTAALQLVWNSLAKLPFDQRQKPVHVISTDTLVENPVVAAWVNSSLGLMQEAAKEQRLPITAHRLTPTVEDTFWVNLIGKGYPAPRHKFRWCTERLKIMPSNRFINEVVRENGEAILVLGTRKAESSKRAHTMNKLEEKRIRENLSPNASLPNSLVFSPIEAWSNDDVWTYLMQVTNPWGYNNKDLLTMYQGASPDGECPLVVDSTTPSCGSSRFGCWVCTIVDNDKSMAAMIQNDEEKEWMLPLLELRDELDVADDRHLRDFRRMTGNVQLFKDRPIPGPYTQDARSHWLRRVLETQQWVRENGPQSMRQLELITLDELREIRRIWVVEKYEVEDLLPEIYAHELHTPFPDDGLDDGAPFGADEMAILRELASDDELHYEQVRHLLEVERRYRTAARRAGLFDALEKGLTRTFYANEDDATTRARDKDSIRKARNELKEVLERRLAPTGDRQLAMEAIAK
jgi:DNA sulfur modification protein DndC